MSQAEQPNMTARLDNAGTLLQSVSTSLVHEKISIVSTSEMSQPWPLNVVLRLYTVPVGLLKAEVDG